MQRRKWILGTAASLGVCLARGSFAQAPGKVWRVGYLSGVGASEVMRGPANNLGAAFAQGMRELGYVEGKNLVIEWRTGGGKLDRLSAVAAELVALKPDVIVVSGSQPTSAAQKATSTIHVMGSSLDPVRDGFVRSLARPGGNITGLANLSGDLGPKYLELILAALPRLSSLAVMTNPSNSGHAAIFSGIQSAAPRFKVKVLRVEIQDAQSIEAAFASMKRENAGAMFVMVDPVTNFPQVRQTIAQLSLKHQLPVFSNFRELIEAGGLMSYGQNLALQYKRAAAYVDKIFKGAKPGDLPVEQSTRLEMVVNARTAKALGITIQPEIFLRADEVIE